MASIRSRTTKAGDTTHQVLFRNHGKQTSRAFVTIEHANRFKQLVDLLGPDRALSELTAEEDSGITVDQLADQFFAWKAHDVEPRTIRDYRRDYDNWIAPHLGHRRADSIDERDVQALVDHMRTRLDPKSVADRHMILHGMFKWGAAKTRRLVEHNPCTETELPKRRRKPAKGLTPPEFQALHAGALRIEPDAADLMLFLVSMAWRFSEATALACRGIEDWGEEMYATVQRVHRRDEHDRIVIVEDRAKSDAGLRRAKVPPTCAAMIRSRMIGLGPDDLVFTNSEGRKWYQTNFGNRTWPRILKEAGLERRPTPHWLKHTHVAGMVRTGQVSMPEIQKRAGHQDIQTTINVYGRSIDDVSAAALEAFDQIMFGPTSVQGELIAGDVVVSIEPSTGGG